MKAFALLLFYLFTAILIGILLSCDEMDDIQKRFVDEEEQIYLGKVDSVEVIPGYGRVKLKWQMSADPRIDRVKIYWNNKQDSTTREFNRTAPGIIEDSLIIENLAEGSYTFELRSENDLGELSLATLASGSVWGPSKGDELGNRNFTGFEFDHETSAYILQLTPVAITNLEARMVFSEITYESGSGGVRTLRISADTNQITLPDFEAGTDFTIRDAFLSDIVIDTVYNNSRTQSSQMVSRISTMSLGIPGNPASDFFLVADSLLWEWAPDGSINIFAIENAAVQPAGMIPADVFSRDSFNVLFSYDFDNLITVSHDGEVTLYNVSPDSITTILTPSGAPAMGTGFTSFTKYLPATGFFYTVSDGSGDLKTWLAQEDATWGSPNGSTVGTGFDKFSVLTVYENGLLGIDQQGGLWRITTNLEGAPNLQTKVGGDWGRFVQFVPIGSAVLALSESGEFYLFDTLPTTSEYWVLE